MKNWNNFIAETEATRVSSSRQMNDGILCDVRMSKVYSGENVGYFCYFFFAF